LVPDKLLASETIDNLPVRGSRLVTNARAGDQTGASGLIISLLGFQTGLDGPDISGVWRFRIRGVHDRCEYRANYTCSSPDGLHRKSLWLRSILHVPLFLWIASKPEGHLEAFQESASSTCVGSE